jgi:hypothetical protein
MRANPLLQSVQLALQNATQDEAMRHIEEVVDFCIEHENGRVFDDWDRNTVKLMVAYHWAKDTLLVLRDDEGNVKGVFMWYHCNESDDWEFVANWEEDRENSDSIFLAFLFAADSESFKQLTRDFLSKCPEAKEKKLLGMRYRSGFPRRITYTYKLFKKILAI